MGERSEGQDEEENEGGEEGTEDAKPNTIRRASQITIWRDLIVNRRRAWLHRFVKNCKINCFRKLGKAFRALLAV